MADAQTASAKALASLCNIDERRVQQLAAEGVMSKVKRGRYKLLESIAGYIRYLQDRSTSTGSTGTRGTVNEERARLLHAQANTAELTAGTLAGSLLVADEVEADRIEEATRIRTALLALPTRIAQVAIAAEGMREIEDAVRVEVHQMMEGLSALADQFGDDPGADVGAAGSAASAGNSA